MGLLSIFYWPPVHLVHPVVVRVYDLIHKDLPSYELCDVDGELMGTS